MPYKTVSNLPANLKEILPKHAQLIFVKAYDNALKQYKDPSKRQGHDDLEATAHKVAWAAVKQVYKQKASGEWVEK